MTAQSYSVAQVRACDRLATEQYHIPSLLLMENAGRGAAELFTGHLNARQQVLVVAGKGNNGGDGFVSARHLHNRGFDVHILLCATLEDLQASPDAWTNFEIVRAMDLPIVTYSSAAQLQLLLRQSAAVVDALFGTGIQGFLNAPYPDIIEAVNDSGLPVFAVDIPSGLNGDTGEPSPVAVRAYMTATFGFLKTGLTTATGRLHCGETHIIDISIPRGVTPT